MADKLMLQGQTAIVTGASRGIGRAVAKRLASDGAQVVVNYVSDVNAANEVAQEIQAAGGKALVVQADVSTIAGLEKLFAEAEKAFGDLHIVVNTAGAIEYKLLTDITEGEFDQLFALNVKGSFFSSQLAAKKLRDGGTIINFSSTVTATMMPLYATYAATKGAVEQFSHILAKEVGHRQIRVNVVSPGPTDTALFRLGKSEEDLKRLASFAALNRIGTTEEIADVVAFLASDQARWITGQNIRVNGGLA